MDQLILEDFTFAEESLVSCTSMEETKDEIKRRQRRISNNTAARKSRALKKERDIKIMQTHLEVRSQCLEILSKDNLTKEELKEFIIKIYNKL